MLALAELLERGSLRGPAARVLAHAWASVSGAAWSGVIVRPLRWPEGVRVVAIGGATLGGSGKTPLAIACAEALASRGARVALVGHAYRARPSRPRKVAAGDALAEVGDEALASAAALGRRAAVVVAPRRQEAIDFAVRRLGADVLVLDGVLQTFPRRAAISLLAVDDVEPWGHGRSVPPCGDLRAPIEALLRACDVVVPVGGDDHVVSRGVWVEEGNALLSWRELSDHPRLGFFCALARPERLLRRIARAGVTPKLIVRVRDHGAVSPSRTKEHMYAAMGITGKGGKGGAAIDAVDAIGLWMASSKCVTHLRQLSVLPKKIGRIDFAVRLSSALADRIAKPFSGQGPPITAALTDGPARHTLEDQ